MGVLVQRMFVEANYTPVVVPLTANAVRNAPVPHTWWACVHMITINQTDICVGDFWATPQRRAYMLPYGAFTTPVAETSMVRSGGAQMLHDACFRRATALVLHSEPAREAHCGGGRLGGRVGDDGE